MDMYTAAEDLDDQLPALDRLAPIAREARKHGCHARVVSHARIAPHVLVVSPEGYTLATRSAVRLARFLGY